MQPSENADQYELHPAWPAFVEHADQEGISLDSIDDFEPWWNCWRKGYEQAQPPPMRVGFAFTPGSIMIAEERLRQITEKGYNLEHDRTYNNQELLVAAAALLLGGLKKSRAGSAFDEVISHLSPEEYEWISYMLNHPRNHYTDDLVIAGALIAAEIDRCNEKNTLVLGGGLMPKPE